MLCEKCGCHQATVSYRSNINGVETRLYLCEECAKGYDFSNLFQKQNEEFSNFFQSLFGEGEVGQPKETGNKNTCPVCQSSFEEIAKSGKLGCAHCYQTFAKELEPTLERMHGGKPVHRGRRPKRVVKEMTDQERIQKLERELQQAVDRQEYEEAARLRDRIAELKAKQEQEGGR